ncbi:MAG: hypothetical protein HC811_07205 [Flammeovirgaceae bacterium]|nr:hypothetical protein [Flammeovirgaceae bacterium]
MAGIGDYLKDPLLGFMYGKIRDAGAIRAVSLDVTNICNLRCAGCYYFEEGMDSAGKGSVRKLSSWIESEKIRGTNFITIVGGEPSLELDGLHQLYQSFKLNVATNGMVKIPIAGFEKLPIGIALWGNNQTDSKLRANGKIDLFKKALVNYKNDERAFWYYTIAPGYAHEVEEVVDRCIQNGNHLLFNYYSDLSNLGGALDHRNGFGAVMEAIANAIEKYPSKIYNTLYFNEIIGTGRLYNSTWGYDVCTNLSENLSINKARFKNGNPFNPHFRAYNSDYETTRRCCTGINRSCESCFDTWEHFSWIMINLRKHAGSKEEFSNWLFTTFIFYGLNRIIEIDNIDGVLSQIHEREQEMSLIKSNG